MSKKESKSQRVSLQINGVKGCYKYRNVKERKQITTLMAAGGATTALLQISQCQRKKANHNCAHFSLIRYLAATNIAMSKKESKSQPRWPLLSPPCRCYKYRNVKERKQITTIHD